MLLFIKKNKEKKTLMYHNVTCLLRKKEDDSRTWYPQLLSNSQLAPKKGQILVDSMFLSLLLSIISIRRRWQSSEEIRT